MNKSIKEVAVLMLTVAAVIVVGCTKPDDPNNGGNNGNNDTIPDHEYVDLGLPSGTLWATCNVGAESPEDFGDYFAWGETSPKEIYDWKSYEYCSFVDGRYVLNKYCTESYYGLDGYVDGLTVLDESDDAVRAEWGDNWRMPTREDWEELLSNTTNMMTEQNGVKGRLIMSTNGNSIFLPATGFYLDDELICLGLGVYWTSSLQTSAQMSAWSFHFDIDECHVCGTYERSRGQVVRAVRMAK